MSGYFQRLAQRGAGTAGGMQFVRPVPSLYGQGTDAAGEAAETAEPVLTVPSSDRAVPTSQVVPSLRKGTPATQQDPPTRSATSNHDRREALQPIVSRTEVQRTEVNRLVRDEAAAPPLPVRAAHESLQEAEPTRAERREPPTSQTPPPTLESLFDAIERPVVQPLEPATKWPAQVSNPAAVPIEPEPPTVSIGKINITVAAPPVPQRAGLARTQGFRSYDALRRGLVR